MKTEAEIKKELRKVRALLAKKRKAGVDDVDILYGAQQALGWIVENLGSPSGLDRTIDRLAEDLCDSDET